jgi:hypothetical protein
MDRGQNEEGRSEIVLSRQYEASRRLHFVSVVKTMRYAWDDGKAERVGLDKYPHHPREHSQRPGSPHPFSPEMQSACLNPASARKGDRHGM